MPRNKRNYVLGLPDNKSIVYGRGPMKNTPKAYCDRMFPMTKEEDLQLLVELRQEDESYEMYQLVPVLTLPK